MSAPNTRRAPKRWFRPKLLGFTPATWEGCVLTVGVALAIGFSAINQSLAPWQHGAIIVGLVVAYGIAGVLGSRR
jgi:hypothetical protein